MPQDTASKANGKETTATSREQVWARALQLLLLLLQLTVIGVGFSS